MKFERFVVGMLETNGYILYDENTRETLIIDPGDEPKTFIQYIERQHLIVKGIILTHYHYDHIGGVEEIKKKYSCPVYIHREDEVGLKNSQLNHSDKGFRKPVSMIADGLLKDGDMIQAGEVVLQVIHTPGHTPGSICLMATKQKIVFTGDTIFDDDLGRTDLEGGSRESMKRTMQNKISKWQDELVIYPGHAESATMSYVRKKNREFLEMLSKKNLKC